MNVLNMRLNWRGSDSSPPHSGQRSSPSALRPSASPAAAVSCASVATSRTLEPAPERAPKVRIRTPSWRAVTLGKFPLIPHLYEGEAADGCCTLDPGRSNGHRRPETH